MTALIDSTEMYLRTLYELLEEGVPPLRARLVERLHVSPPSVSETTARMAQDGLLEIAGDRTVRLTEKGLTRATHVMRKHRLAELLLTEVIGLHWALVHNEACRWEHVISDAVEERLAVILGDPRRCPHGNAIPPASGPATAAGRPAPRSLLAAAAGDGADRAVTLAWISERLQTDEAAMRRLHDAGLLPGVRLHVRAAPLGVAVRHPAGAAELPPAVAAFVYVEG